MELEEEDISVASYSEKVDSDDEEDISQSNTESPPSNCLGLSVSFRAPFLENFEPHYGWCWGLYTGYRPDNVEPHPAPATFIADWGSLRRTEEYPISPWNVTACYGYGTLLTRDGYLILPFTEDSYDTYSRYSPELVVVDLCASSAAGGDSILYRMPALDGYSEHSYFEEDDEENSYRWSILTGRDLVVRQHSHFQSLTWNLAVGPDRAESTFQFHNGSCDNAPVCSWECLFEDYGFVVPDGEVGNGKLERLDRTTRKAIDSVQMPL